MSSTAQAGILVLVWVNGIMYLMRQFAGGISHKVSPIALIAVTAVFAAAGLYLFSHAQTPAAAFGAAALLAVGTAFWWPTMLGITSERFPRTGALGLAIIGGTGSFATAIAGPVMGRLNDMYGPREMLAIWAILPVTLIAIFGAIYLRDKAARRIQGRAHRRVGTDNRDAAMPGRREGCRTGPLCNTIADCHIPRGFVSSRHSGCDPNS